MNKHRLNALYTSVGFLTAFLVWTAAVRLIDVQAVGPLGTTVGFASLNRFFHGLTGVMMSLYLLTDWLGLIPIGFALGFAVLGASQWVRRKSLRETDADLLVLGGFYLAAAGAYLLFEQWPVNYRPILINGVLEASYPSSTTLLVLTVMPTAVRQLRHRVKNRSLGRIIAVVITVFSVFTVVCRLLSGVHWVTDIVGGVLLSAGLVKMYDYFTN